MVIAHYGYKDGSGEYYITIDTDKCNSCSKCVDECPKNIFQMVLDDYDDLLPQVRKEVITVLRYECDASYCNYRCQKVCPGGAITHSW